MNGSGETNGGTCATAVAEALQAIGGKWAFPVIAELYYGPRRFNELRRRLAGISIKSLTDMLRQLERLEMLDRTVLPTNPVSVEYALTAKGRAFRAVLESMRVWGETWPSKFEG